MTGDELTSMQQSILKEIGSMGTAHAATALAKMTGRRIAVMPTTMHVIALDEVYALFSAVPELQLGIYLRMMEGVDGCVVFFVPKGKAYGLVDVLIEQPKKKATAVLGEMEQSVLREAGGVICAAYINAIAAMTGITIRLSVPKLIFDHRGEVLESILKALFPPATTAIVIENEFSLEDKRIAGYFLFVPRPATLEHLFQLMEAHVR